MDFQESYPFGWGYLSVDVQLAIPPRSLRELFQQLGVNIDPVPNGARNSIPSFPAPGA